MHPFMHPLYTFIAIFTPVIPVYTHNIPLNTLCTPFIHLLYTLYTPSLHGVQVFAGALCGAVAQGVCCPTDVVKIRLQGDAAGTRYRGVGHAFSSIARSEGLRGLYQGVAPASQRAAVVAAVELSTYDSFKTFLLPHTGDTIVTHFAAALMAGYVEVSMDNIQCSDICTLINMNSFTIRP